MHDEVHALQRREAAEALGHTTNLKKGVAHLLT